MKVTDRKNLNSNNREAGPSNCSDESQLINNENVYPKMISHRSKKSSSMREFTAKSLENLDHSFTLENPNKSIETSRPITVRQFGPVKVQSVKEKGTRKESCPSPTPLEAATSPRWRFGLGRATRHRD